MGLRWEYEPGPTDPENRLSQRLDLTAADSGDAGDAAEHAGAGAQLMASKGYGYSYNGAWMFATDGQSERVEHELENFLPRFGVNYRLSDDSVVRFAYARYLMPISNVRDTLGDFVQQYAGFAQTTNDAGAGQRRPQQTLNDPFPADQPGDRAVRADARPLHRSRQRRQLRQYELRPQINDRFTCRTRRRSGAGWWSTRSYFFNLGTRVPYDINLNMRGSGVQLRAKTVLNTQVTNPFRNYLTLAIPGVGDKEAGTAGERALCAHPQTCACASGGRRCSSA